jgi:hypothetical protein
MTNEQRVLNLFNLHNDLAMSMMNRPLTDAEKVKMEAIEAEIDELTEAMADVHHAKAGVA